VDEVRAHPHAKRGHEKVNKVRSALLLLNNVATASKEQKALLVEVGVPALLPSCIELEHGDEAITQDVCAFSLCICFVLMHS
jgi:hypothetical protein